MTGPQKLIIVLYIIIFLVYAFLKSTEYESLTITGTVLFTVPFAAAFFLAKEYEFKDEETFPKIVKIPFTIIGLLIGYLIISSL